MLEPKRVREQRKLISPELDAEKREAMKLFDVFKKNQSPEFIAAAKQVNAKLLAAGLDALVLVES